MAVFRVERIKDYTVMSNHHLRNKNLSLKAKGLLSQMLSLPDDWDYTLKGLAAINKESVDAIRTAIWELEDAGYVVRTRVRDERGCLRGCDYYVYEYPQTPSSGSGGSAEPVPPMLEPLASDSAALGNPMQLNKEIAAISFSFCGSILLHISYPAVLNSDCSASFLVLVSFSCSLCFFFM